MSYLFIDTTDHLVLGLLDQSFNWMAYIDQDNKKNSGKIHGNIYSLLNDHQLEITQLKGVIQIAGPGSYTGMRLSEGMVQVFEWNGIPTFSFHHFEVPRLLGDTIPYLWLSNAFKGEFFCYTWDGKQAHTELLNLDQMREKVADYPHQCYTHFVPQEQFEHLASTSSLLHLQGKAFLEGIVKSNKRVQAYYYRELDSEFKASFV